VLPERLVLKELQELQVPKVSKAHLVVLPDPKVQLDRLVLPDRKVLMVQLAPLDYEAELEPLARKDRLVLLAVSAG
jgi:hypothetical protein